MKIQINKDSGFLSFKDTHYGPNDEVEVTDAELQLIQLSGFTTFTTLKQKAQSKEIA